MRYPPWAVTLAYVPRSIDSRDLCISIFPLWGYHLCSFPFVPSSFFGVAWSCLAIQIKLLILGCASIHIMVVSIHD
ncbi:hypothetical protein PISMIDRAFT_153748 [Pisolithus microcarpus 441]|uniref:Uncharacterized protein n=1 Tax=Pisolithus microcarpus 441 TaxID=765257 RepID=A0A0C9Y3X7_9AGAM|nr:hypothetical protein BKA83DRAFT_153748 [Pisolithus microcarpus]KIK19395.1 hypothetical protein PISMIDRAFT_153748 [Pisolithus microcarpus 441]